MKKFILGITLFLFAFGISGCSQNKEQTVVNTFEAAPTELVEEIKQLSASSCYILKILPDSQPGLFDSKFGGLPYWDLSMPYPADLAGNKLVLLAQINFDQYPVDEPLPQGGMLQFYAGQDDFVGMDDQKNGFRVVYHPHIDSSVTMDEIRALDIPTHEGQDYFPVFQSAAVTLEEGVTYLWPDDYLFDDIFAQAWENVTGEALKDGEDFRDVLGEEAQNIL
ncbi:MAG: DUF1963 domain-containing protein [Lachnospiraceae bacterium]|jgi:uncharacterized protein YwqG|nr:DUF1963 domain-containing protein [Lachnospiraceae bacterium]